MNELTTVTATLPDLIDRAASVLSSARDSAEVLEARDRASVAYDASKKAGRMAKAKKAHEEVIAAVYRAQADALLIEARAKMRLADEYDAAQARGEVGVSGQRNDLVGEHNEVPTAADLGLRRDEIHEARQLRDAENADPGATERALSDMVDSGEEPTKAKLRRVMTEKKEEERQAEPQSPAETKLRAEFRRMTPEAQENDWIALRSENTEAQKRIVRQRSDIADLKMQIKQLSEGDKGKTIGNLHRQIVTLKGARDDALTKAAKETRRANRMEAEWKKARRSLESQEIEI